MKKAKLYFRSVDDNICYPLQKHLEDAKDEELTKITLIEAIPDNHNKDYVWCSYSESMQEKSLCSKNNCTAYTSKSGRGKCEHRGNLHNFGEEVVFDVLNNELSEVSYVCKKMQDLIVENQPIPNY